MKLNQLAILAATTILTFSCSSEKEGKTASNETSPQTEAVETVSESNPESPSNSEQVVAPDATNEEIAEEGSSESPETPEPTTEEVNATTPETSTSSEEKAPTEVSTSQVSTSSPEPPADRLGEIEKEPTKTTTTAPTTGIVAQAPKINHDAFDVLLKKYVTADGRVNYKGFKSERSKLDAYCNYLSSTPPKDSWSKSDKLAYWINVYNAFTVQLIVDNYPTSSITKLYNGKPWDRRFVKVGDKTYTLSEVENKVIRPTFKEPRIHFAVNCASFSCPILLNEAYVGSKLNSQLDKMTKKFVNDPKRNKLSTKSVELSQIFEWYAEDFKPAGGALKYVQKYSKITISDKAKVSYIPYDWSLNE